MTQPNPPDSLELLMKEKIKMRDGEAILVMVKNSEVIHFSWNMSLPHVEFVKRTAGELPEGAWVGTVSKLEGEVAAMRVPNTSLVINCRPRQTLPLPFGVTLNSSSSV